LDARRDALAFDPQQVDAVPVTIPVLGPSSSGAFVLPHAHTHHR
jgi:hypothetical protein